MIRFSVIGELTPISLFLHHKCLSYMPAESLYINSLSALVCGKNFDLLQDSYLYTSTGLIHLFVVSGSHLIVLKKIIDQISKLFLKKEFYIITILLLLVYCAVCQFNAPVVRSFCFLSLSTLLTKIHRKWSPDYILFLAGFLALSLKPEWLSSLSLQMSWLASLVLLIYQQKLQNHPLIVRQTIFYFIFSFCFRILGFPAFSITILCVLMTPILEYILFPLALLTTLLHVIEPIFAFVISTLNYILSLLSYSSTPSEHDMESVKYLNWVTIFSCHYLLFFKKEKT